MTLIPGVSDNVRTSKPGGTVTFTLARDGDTVHALTLPLTPEEIVIQRPSRQSVTQTLTSAYQDHLGSGLTSVMLRGHTGWRDFGFGTGHDIIIRLRDEILGSYDKLVAQGDPEKVNLDLAIALPDTGWEHFRVSKNSATFSRSRAQPLLYRYEMQFTVLKDYNESTSQVDPSPNFVFIPTKFEETVVNKTPYDGNVPKPYTGRGQEDDDEAHPGHPAHTHRKPKKTTGDDGPKTVTGGEGGPTTVGGLANHWYSPQGGAGEPGVYPPGMWAYVIKFNRKLFDRPPFNAQTALSKNIESYYMIEVAAGAADPGPIIAELNNGEDSTPSDSTVVSITDPYRGDPDALGNESGGVGAGQSFKQVDTIWYDVGPVLS